MSGNRFRKSIVSDVHAAFGSALLDFAELGLILVDVVRKGKHQLLGVLRAHDYAAHHGA